MNKTLFILVLFLGKFVFADTNIFYYKPVDPSFIHTNKIILNYDDIKIKNLKKKGQLFRTEILYGGFENLDAHILMSRETKNMGYLITYNRYKIDSYSTNNKKIFNSAYGYDQLNSGINLFLFDDLLLNFDINYLYRIRGLMFNTNYNNQFKREIIFSPQLKYFISEKSYFYFNFLYSNRILTLEGSPTTRDDKYYYFNTEIFYNRIWSTVNSFQFYFDNIQDYLQIGEETKNNNYAQFKVNDKFALSRTLVFDLGSAFHVNKNYPFIISPHGSLSLLFNKINFQLGYEQLYDFFYTQNILFQNDFAKYSTTLHPRINHSLFLSSFLSLLKSLNYQLIFSYNRDTNHPELKFDNDNIIMGNTFHSITYFKIQQELFWRLLKQLNVIIQYTSIPYSQPLKITHFNKNKLSLQTELFYSFLKFNFTSTYKDFEYFLDPQNNYISILPSIYFDIGINAFITPSFGVMLKINNLSSKKIFHVPLYPEMQNIINFGITAGF